MKRIAVSDFPALTFTLAIILCSFAMSTTATSRPHSLKFYMYVKVKNESLADPAPYTAILSAQPSVPENFSFGIIHTFDNPLFNENSLSSTNLGRVQGWYGDVGQSVLTLFLCQTFTISTKKYSGTFSLLGVDVVTDLYKLAPIVGGTGDFAYARGIANQTLISTQIIDSETTSWFYYDVRFKY